MPASLRRLAGAPIALLPLVGALAQHRALATYRALPALPPAEPSDRPLVSIIVPARNEADNLKALLPSLQALRYEPRELIVVDDDSADETAAVARGHGARVVRTGGDPPAGWTGKAWACQRGASVADGAWLLFTDAATVHAPESLDAALAAARAGGLDALSLVPEPRAAGFWQRLLLPIATGARFAGLAADRVNRSPDDALLDGSYLLVARPAYNAVNGHAAVAGQLAEDLALAIRLSAAGRRLGLYRSAGLVTKRAPSDPAELAASLTRLTVGLLELAPRRGAGLVAAALLAASAGPTATALRTPLAILSVAAAASAQARWCRVLGLPAWLGLLQPLAGATLLGIAARAAAAALRRQPIAWKGRAYRL